MGRRVGKEERRLESADLLGVDECVDSEKRLLNKYRMVVHIANCSDHQMNTTFHDALWVTLRAVYRVYSYTFGPHYKMTEALYSDEGFVILIPGMTENHHQLYC